MISIKLVLTGSYLVREQYNELRHILLVTDDDRVSYLQYDLNTGEPVSTLPFMCRRKQITRWADRAATRDEIALLRTDAEVRMQETIRKVLEMDWEE